MAFVAYYFHWSKEEIMEMEHKERKQWCEEISRINKQVSSDSEPKNIFDVF